MKEKIFNALKQKYSHLGLGDETLQSVAESLANTGLVTEENLDTVVAGQESMLKGYQSTFDRMRTENANYKKEIETLKGKGGDPNITEPNNDNEEPGWFKAYLKRQEEKEAAAKAEADKVKAAADRKDLILKKAKELKISQERIDEGFLIPDDMDENAINTYLSKVKSNEAAKSLEDRSPFSLSSTAEESKREAEEWADSLPDKH